MDHSNVVHIDSAIKKSELGLNPQIDGQLIRLPIPDLSEERRVEMKKMVKAMGEKCKVSIRNIRRDGNDELKKLLKNKDISEDDEKKFEKTIQDHTDNNIKLIDEKVSVKRKRNNDNMNSPKHVAIIMDGNGRWGLKKKIQETMVTKKVLKRLKRLLMHPSKKNKVFNIICFFNRKLEKTNK